MTNWFEQGGRAYARFRPEYPRQLGTYLAELAPEHRVAVDVGCGNGQLTQLLVPYFERVVGLDPSEDQIANAAPGSRIEFQCAAAEELPLADGSANLITAAQAAHWFELPAFYREVRRVGASGAVVALISYGVLKLEASLNERFQRFYREEVGPYWPPERKLVDSGYATIEFPFDEITPPALNIDVEWHLSEFLGYMLTWSAVKRAKDDGNEAVLMAFANEFAALWGNPDRKRPVSWPVNMRIGRL
ncbi:methyltransferase domain-containing protein [Pseudoduganella eburnea]|uniref:Methyltransferase domain-containing protein n=1 Tax=Massilia eburnea TaxID=1776165 RepID=A0A6L6QBI7_9BURK|nr:class I SAM-dependent methyltransferase [Massilia eburnea]MTW09868.1 methyltransferase domain-containing protein [Massilia eburnea]